VEDERLSTSWDDLTDELRCYGRLDKRQQQAVLRELPELESPTAAEAAELLEALATSFDDVLEPTSGQIKAAELLLERLSNVLQQWQPDLARSFAQSIEELASATRFVEKIYRTLGPKHPLRYQLLRLLNGIGGFDCWDCFVRLISDDPPPLDREADLVFLPLFRPPHPPASVLFPRLLSSITLQSVAALILDLANLYTTQRLTIKHPAVDRTDQLATLFSGLADYLTQVEARPQDFAESPAQLSELVHRSVTLGTSLAVALGLCGDAAHVAALRKAHAVGHRRLRAEAAAALAKLGAEDGLDSLAELARDSGARLRALTYLQELQELDRVEEQYRTPEAWAEAEMASFLALPTQFGMPPHYLDVLDARELYWPGGREVQPCYLFRYAYRWPQGSYQGVGLVGPLTFSLRLDVRDLTPAELYSLYCGWHVDHAEIQQRSAEELTAEEQAEFQEIVGRLEAQGFGNLRLHIRGRFFGTVLYVAEGVQNEQPGFLIYEEGTIVWRPRIGSWATLTAQQAYFVHVGRKILREFNSQEDFF